MKGGLVCVNPMFRINGDVDYSTGNVEVEKDLYISGSVCSGFTVKAGENATIAGTVEPGATVRMRGDLNVGNGILGETTRVVVLGELRTRFIQNATVMVKGDVWVGSYIHNASVRCGGKLTVQMGGGSRGGSVVGGTVCATQGIEVSSAGSASTTGTVLSVQADPEEKVRLDKLREGIAFCDDNITKMMRTLGLHTIDPQRVQAVLSRAPAAKKAHYVQILSKLNELVKHKRASLEEIEKLEVKIGKDLRKAEVKVTNTLFGGVKVHIGSEGFTSQVDLGPTVLQLKEDKMEIEGGLAQGSKPASNQ